MMPPPPSGSGSAPDVGAIETCRQDAFACASKAASPQDVNACGQTFAQCVSKALPSGGLGGLPGGGLPGGGCPGRGLAGGRLPGGGLPGGGLPGGGLPQPPDPSCLVALNQCLLGGGAVMMCTDQARMCSGGP